MDALNASLIPIEDRVYRLILPNSDSSEKNACIKPQIRTHDEVDDESYDPNLLILHQGDKFYINFNVPQQLVGLIIGHGGKTRKILEQQGASIDVGRKKDGGMITISGATKMVVGITYQRIMDKINSARLRNDSTHFISVPINSHKIQESFCEFKAKILENYKKVRGIDESIFQIPAKLHLTITPLILLDERDNQKAIAILTKCTDSLLKDFGGKEFIVEVRGLEYMNDDPAEVDVLYAEVHEIDGDNRLQIIADKVMNEFCKENLSKKQYDKVKLHITLMNTLFRSKLENEEEKDQENRQTFDARAILQDFKDYNFGQIVLSEIHISVRYTTTPDGYYIAIKKVKLNQ